MNGAYTYARLNGQEFDESKIDFHGNLPKYYNYLVGFNSRLDALQAAMLAVKLPHLDDWNERRRQIAAIYNEKITNPLFTKPVVAEYNEHIFYVYPMKVSDRSRFRAYMEEKNMSEKWRSSSVFSEADVLFRFRFIPNLTLTTANYIKIGTDRFDITSVENVRQRKMYYEVLAKHTEESDG